MKMEQKIRILFVSPGFGMGGSTTALMSILNSPLAKEYDMDVFAISKSGYCETPLPQHDIGQNDLTTAFYSDFSRLGRKTKIHYFYVKAIKQIPIINKYWEKWIIKSTIRKIEKRKKYDIVVAYQELIATKFSQYFKCPYKMAWVHCDYANTYSKDFDELAIYQKYAKIVCVSQFTKEGFVKKYPSLCDKTIAIHNLYDETEILRKANENINDEKFHKGRFTILSVGRICDVKRFYMIPEIASELVAKGFDFKWFIIGNASQKEELQKVENAIRENHVDEQVVYLGGKTNPFPYYKSADLLVVLSKSEACPMIFNEAKILNLPVLSTDFGSAFEFVEDGKNGFVVPIEQMSESIFKLANDNQMLASLKGNGMTMKYENNNTLSLMRNLFNEVCDG